MSEGEIAYIKPVSIDTLSSITINEPLGPFLALNPAQMGWLATSSYIIVTENGVASQFLSLSDVYRPNKTL